MQLKPLTQGRYSQEWQSDYPLVERVLLSCVSEQRRFAPGEALMQQGQKLNQLVLVPSGKIAMSYSARNGRNFQLGTLKCDSQLFGEMEFFTQNPCQLDILAQTTLTCGIIPADKLQQALSEHPRLALFFASAIAIDYQDTVDIFTRRMLYPISYNIAYDLYHQQLDDLPVSGFNKGYLEAERFGTTARVYRRAIQSLEDAGLVRRSKGKLEIMDLKALQDFVEQGEL